MPSRSLTGNNRQREQRVQSVMLDRLVLRYRRRIANEIARAMRAAARNLAAGEALPVDTAIAEHRARIARLMSRLWTESGEDMAGHLAGGEKALARMQRKNDFDDYVIPATEQADRVMIGWIDTVGGQKITEITKTTQRNITDQIATGIAEGLSEKQIAKRIQAVASQIGGSRADTIARTETHAAANVSANAVAQAAGLSMKKEWAASRGLRTRPAHREADGQRVGLNETFTVDGEQLRYPGDSHGSASNVINCRCAVLYVLSD